MGEQCIRTGFRRRWIEDELRLPILLLNRIVMADDHRAIRMSVHGDTQSKKPEIHAECQDGRAQKTEKNSENNSS